MPEAEHLEETSFDQAEGSIAYDYEVIHLLLSDNFLVHKRGAKLGFGWLFSLLISKNRWTFLTHGDMIWTSPGGGSSSISPVGRILSIKKDLRRLGWDPGFKVSWYWNPCRCAGLSFFVSDHFFGWSLILVTNSGPKKWPKKNWWSFFVIMDDFFMIIVFSWQTLPCSIFYWVRQDAAVNVNVWLAPDRACRKGGGLNIYKSRPQLQPKRQKRWM